MDIDFKSITDSEMNDVFINIDEIDIPKKQSQIDYENQFEKEIAEMQSPYYTGVHAFRNRSRLF